MWRAKCVNDDNNKMGETRWHIFGIDLLKKCKNFCMIYCMSKYDIMTMKEFLLLLGLCIKIQKMIMEFVAWQKNQGQKISNIM